MELSGPIISLFVLFGILQLHFILVLWKARNTQLFLSVNIYIYIFIYIYIYTTYIGGKRDPKWPTAFPIQIMYLHIIYIPRYVFNMWDDDYYKRGN